VTALNLHVFRWINGWPPSWAPFLVFFSQAVNQLWFKVAILFLVIGMLAAGIHSRATACIALIAVCLANPSTDLWKHLLPDPRPANEIGNVILRLGNTPHAGTASAHAANMASVATVFAIRERWWGAPWVLAAILVGFSRVYAGVHYPYQVLLGWATGICCATLVLSAYRLLESRRGSVVSSSDQKEKPQTS
jgi:membrane-associated phospholipid phosphatase